MKSNAKPGKKRKATKSVDPLLTDLDTLPPLPAFRPFELEDERHGRRKLRRLGKCIDCPKLAPNFIGELHRLYTDAIGQSSAKWEIVRNRKGDFVHQEKHVASSPEDAARDMIILAKNAVFYLSMLVEREPGLCRQIAATQAEWPVMVDLTEKDWQRPISDMITKLGLGSDIKGYLQSARTADQNVIRCWATAIYDTLFQTRCEFKRAVNKPDEYRTTEGCPEWARKTLDLPTFTKSHSRSWAKLGEEMLLQQMPEFLDSADLAGKKFSWTQRACKDSRSGKASLRAVHREAFEDFAKELKNIAPERDIWKGQW